MVNPQTDPHQLIETTFDKLPGWENDDSPEALRAFAGSAERIIHGRYRQKSLGIDPADYSALAKAAIDLCTRSELSQCDARNFFENGFTPFRLAVKSLEPFCGHVTGYFEPIVLASRIRTEKYSAPIYSRPPDLVDLNTDNHPRHIGSEFAFARQTSSGLVEYHDRPAIENGALSNKQLELAYVADKVDAFFIHVQGSARLQFPDGEELRITYAAKSGHTYSSIGKHLLKTGELSADDCGMDALRFWFKRNPDRVDSVLNRNRSFIFFKAVSSIETADGPIGAAKIPLISGRSLAVDRNIHTFGVPIYVDTKTSLPRYNLPWQRLMVAHDTGSAIMGLARGDLFIGSGDEAGSIAGEVNHAADFYILLPKGLDVAAAEHNL